MTGRVEIGRTDDGEKIVILHPSSRFKEDVEAQRVRDAMDSLAEFFLSIGDNRIAEELFAITEVEDTADGNAPVGIHMLTPGEAPMADLVRAALETAPPPQRARRMTATEIAHEATTRTRR